MQSTDIKTLRSAELHDDLQLIDEALQDLNQIILGKAIQVRLSVACLLAGGHLLIEDMPGVGKTTLAHALARILGLVLPAHTVHQRPVARRHHRRLGLRSRTQHLPFPSRAGVLAAGAG